MLDCWLVVDVGNNSDFLNFATFRQPYYHVFIFLRYVRVYFYVWASGLCSL